MAGVAVLSSSLWTVAPCLMYLSPRTHLRAHSLVGFEDITVRFCGSEIGRRQARCRRCPPPTAACDGSGGLVESCAPVHVYRSIYGGVLEIFWGLVLDACLVGAGVGIGENMWREALRGVQGGGCVCYLESGVLAR